MVLFSRVQPLCNCLHRVNAATRDGITVVEEVISKARACEAAREALKLRAVPVIGREFSRLEEQASHVPSRVDDTVIGAATLAGRRGNE